METQDNFAEWMRTAMAEQSVTGVVLSRVTGIDPSQLSTYVNGKYKPGTDNQWLIRKALDGSRASRQAIKRAQSMRRLSLTNPNTPAERAAVEAFERVSSESSGGWREGT